VVFGHFGDRIGRKRLPVISLLLMGGSSVLIGLLPSYHQIGVAAPTLLVLLRLVQGFALGGEFGGAVLLVAEHGPANRRGFWTSWPQTGGPLGNLLATGALAMTAAITTSADYLAGGWRMPFVASIALVIIGLWIRARVNESPLFTEIVKHQDRQRAPLVAALRHPRPLFSVFAARIGKNATFYVFTIFLFVGLRQPYWPDSRDGHANGRFCFSPGTSSSTARRGNRGDTGDSYLVGFVSTSRSTGGWHGLPHQTAKRCPDLKPDASPGSRPGRILERALRTFPMKTF
jgi:MFS family permease